MDGYEYLYTSCNMCNLTMLIDSSDYTNNEDNGTICFECLDLLMEINP